MDYRLVIEQLEAGSYLVRGDPPAIIHHLSKSGRVELCWDARELTFLASDPLGGRVYYLCPYEGKKTDLPRGLLPPRTYRMVIPPEESWYKTPPAGYHYLDLRGLQYDPLQRFRERYGDPEDQILDVASQLWHALARKDIRPWLDASDLVFQLLPPSGKGGLYWHLSVGREALQLEWFLTGERAGGRWREHPRIRFRLLANRLLFLQSRYQCLSYKLQRWYWQPPKPPSRLPMGKLRGGIIQAGREPILCRRFSELYV